MRKRAFGVANALAVLVIAWSPTASGQDDLGDTKTPPPSQEDLGGAPAAPAPAPAAPETPPAPPPPKKKSDKKADAKKPAEPEKKPEAPPPVVAAVAPEVAQKAAKIHDEVTALLAAEPGDARALENISTQWNDDKLLAADAALKPLLKLARGRALTIQGRFDEAASALSDAKGLTDGVSPQRESRRLAAQVRFRQGELEEVRTKGSAAPSCGPLGLSRVAALEGREARDRVQRLAARYKASVQAGDRFWGRRAAFRTAMLYEDLYRFAIKPPAGYRGVALPRPFAVGAVDARAVVGDVLGGAWPAEISRLYSEVIASIDAREPDDILLEQAKKRAAAFAKLEAPPGEKAENPWFKDEKPGLVRFNRRFEKKNPDGSWSPIDAKPAKEALLGGLAKGPGTVEHAYALVALAEAGPAPSTEHIIAALGHADERVELAGLLAAEKAPDPALLDILVEIAAKPEKKEAFATLQSALFGVRERALLALRSLAAKDRTIAEKILADSRLPARERAWVVAEVGDGRLEYAFQALVSDRDPVVAATALYGLYLSIGKNSLGYLRQNDTGVVGCVSKAIAAIDAEPTR